MQHIKAPVGTGAKVRRAREAAGLSVQQLAEQLDCAHGFITYLEADRTLSVNPDFVARIAKALGADVQDWLTPTPSPPSS